MMIIGIPGTVIAVASAKRTPYIKALTVMFISAAVVGGITFYAFGLVTPKAPAQNQNSANTTQAGPGAPKAVELKKGTVISKISIMPGASAKGNPNFNPNTLSVAKNSGIIWTNNDNVPHTVTSFKDQGKTFDSSIIMPKKTFTIDASKLKPSEYDYFCTIHPFMKAKFTVK
jgi:plastocyanin